MSPHPDAELATGTSQIRPCPGAVANEPGSGRGREPLSPTPNPWAGGWVEKGAAEGGCRPDSVPRRAASIPLDLALPQGSSGLPGGLARGCGRRGRVTLDPPIRPCSAWGLPCPLRHRTGGALLPHPFTLTPGPIRGRSALCGTFPRVAAAGRYPACYPSGVRTFLYAHGGRSGRPPPPAAPFKYTSFRPG